MARRSESGHRQGADARHRRTFLGILVPDGGGAAGWGQCLAPGRGRCGRITVAGPRRVRTGFLGPRPPSSVVGATFTGGLTSRQGTPHQGGDPHVRGVAGAEPKPKRIGGATGASPPRSAPSHRTTAPTIRCKSRAPWYSRRPPPALPVVRTPGRQDAAGDRSSAASRPGWMLRPEIQPSTGPSRSPVPVPARSHTGRRSRPVSRSVRTVTTPTSATPITQNAGDIALPVLCTSCAAT